MRTWFFYVRIESVQRRYSMMKRHADFWLAIAQGSIIGATGLIPGASGGVLAVSMGIYRPIVDAVLSLLKAFRKNFFYLLPYGIGIAVGILLAARGLEWLLSHYRAALMYSLMGMVLGGIPQLIRDANAEGFHGRYLAGTLVGLVGWTLVQRYGEARPSPLRAAASAAAKP
ncbi:MAG: DUF368 domain-containing protein [Clostridia bacterium]|nr:DUF368 domain-containing protein [Clostridia bacterium]